MRAFPPPAGAPAVRLSVDEGALVIGLLDFLCEPTLRLTPDVIGLADRTRKRVSAALAGAINEGSLDFDDRFDRLRRDVSELQVIARHVGQLVGTSGPVAIPADDERLSSLRTALGNLAA